VLSVQNVSKRYQLYERPIDRIREALPIGNRVRHRDFWALREISFDVQRGEIVSIVGPNGCGKSTLLQIVSGILPPTSGRVTKNGRVAALLELGTGFNPEFTGRENVFVNGELLGVDREQMTRALPAIQDFADIGDFIDRPVKEYSSGMYVRLAFATAIHVDPEILIVDEALAVGDAVFANRCVRKFQELKERKVTILFVSHDLGLVKQLSNRAIFLLNGTIQADGDPKYVTDRYIGTVLAREAQEEARDHNRPLRASHQHGDQTIQIASIELLNVGGDPLSVVKSGQLMTVRIIGHVRTPHTNPMAGILIRSRIGMEVYGTNTQIENINLGEFKIGDRISIDFRFNCWLTPQTYSLTAAIQDGNGTSLDWLEDALSFEVIGDRRAAGVVDLRAAVKWTRTVD
jgi:lipopolysaccharide transport system ATP-binding protein